MTAHEKVSRSPGRPRSFEPDAVLDAALELFWKQGYRSTTTRDLESALGLSQSSISNTFGTKPELLEAALGRYEALADAALLSPLERSRDGLDAIDTFFLALHRWVSHEGRRGCLLINLMAEDGGVTDSIKARARAYRRRVRAAIRKNLVPAAKRGETDAGSADTRADLLMGLLLGMNIAARGGVPEDELQSMLDAIRAQLNVWRLAS